MPLVRPSPPPRRRSGPGGPWPGEWVGPALLLTLTALTLTALASPTAARAESWPAGPFETDAVTLRARVEAAETRARSHAEADDDVVVLWRDDRYRFDADGRLEYRRHWVYVVRRAEALDAWSTSEARWSPWHQNPPRLRSRVLSTTGAFQDFVLAPEQASTTQVDPFGDQRSLVRLPLDRVTVGAVVEEELLLEDREPLFAGGVSYRHPLVLPVPIDAGRLVLEAPTELQLRFGVVLAPGLEPRRTVEGGWVRLEFDYRHRGAATPVEPWQPGSAPRFPHVAFSTGADWAAVGAAYVAGLDEGLPPPEAPSGILARGSSEERIEALVATLRRRVRPLPRTLEATPLVPNAPAVVLERGRGDSQDLAAVLVSWLRSQGIPAHVALVASGFGQDVEPRMPGLGLFDRALVYVPEGRALWIDPTDPWSRPGELPAEVRDRWALVASPTVRQLIRTPTARAEDNRSELAIEVEMADSGGARIVERATYHGDVERAQRRLAASLRPDDRRRAYLDYVRTAYLGRELGGWSETDPADLADPYQLEIEALGAERGFTEGDASAFAIHRRDLLVGLPPELFLETTTPRRAPFVFRRPFSTVRTYRIRPPAGFRPTAIPESEGFAVGGGRFEQEIRIDGGQLVAVLKFSSGPTELTPEQLAAYRLDARRLLTEEPLIFELRKNR